MQKLLKLIFPPKCILCQRILTSEEEDFCKDCRKDISPFPPSRHKLTYIVRWTTLWHYEHNVRESIIRFKFGNRPSYGIIFGKYLSEKILSEDLPFDIITSVPISWRRKWKRGYDQTRIIAQSISSATGKPYVAALRKIRHTKPQSLLRTASERRGNVLGSYAVLNKADVIGKRILLIDDVITTGATVSECARTLLTAGAESVCCGAIASAIKINHTNR